MRSSFAFIISNAVLLSSPSGYAATGPGAAASAADTAFLLSAAANHATEIKLAELARQRAQSPHIRTLGRLTAEAHFRILTRAIPLLVRAEGFLSRPFAGPSFEYDHLQSLGAGAFDAEYWRIVLSRQQRLLVVLRKEAATDHSQDVSAYATHALVEVSKVFSSAQAVPNPYPVIPK